MILLVGLHLHGANDLDWNLSVRGQVVADGLFDGVVLRAATFVIVLVLGRQEPEGDRVLIRKALQ